MLKLFGILNVTPDSFSDGGDYVSLDNALARGLEMIADGAEFVDVGGESTGPGSEDVSVEEELGRVLPVVKDLCEKGVKVSVDTYKAEVASACLKAGAVIINDVTALRGDKGLVDIVIEAGCSVVMMYSKDDSARTTVDEVEYDDVIKTVGDFFEERLEFFESRGGDRSKVILDPGMGHFVSSKAKYSLEIITLLGELKARFPENEFLLGISRKSFLGGDLKDRDKAGLALSELAALNGADFLRVHDVRLHSEYLKKYL